MADTTASTRLKVEIVTPAQVAYSGEAEEVQAPGIIGEFGVLIQHAALLSVTRPGVVTVHGGSQGPSRFLVGGGFAEVGPGEVTLLVDLCESVDSIDKAQAKQALADAVKTMETADPSTGEWAEANKAAVLNRARLDA